MDVDCSDKPGAAGGTASSSGDASSGAAMQVVTASLANVKSVIRSGAADRYQVIDMLTSLLRETLQVNHQTIRHALPRSSCCLLLQMCTLLCKLLPLLMIVNPFRISG